MSPKSIDKRVNNFINDKVKTNQGAATIVFEELSKCAILFYYDDLNNLSFVNIAANTGKVHRQALHQKLDELDDVQVRLRGSTAGVGIRLNPKLASKYGRSDVSTNRQREPTNPYDYSQPATTKADSNMKVSKSGITHYPGAPMKVSTNSLLGQTLDKFEMGVQDKKKLHQQDGVEYYNKHIRPNEQ